MTEKVVNTTDTQKQRYAKPTASVANFTSGDVLTGSEPLSLHSDYYTLTDEFFEA